MHRPTVIYPGPHGDLVVDSIALTPGTFVQVFGLFVLFASLLAGVLAAGNIF
ncbi:MAG: hypothetical protein ACYCW6_11975 [Candidatus Xenobia bacterium]